MGWTAGDDTLTQVSLSFPTVEAAIDYAERQGLPYTVDRDQRPSSGAVSRPAEPAADDAEPESRPGLPGLWLDEAYGLGVSVGYQPTTNAGDPRDWRSFASPLDVVASRLSIDEKRSILSDWWWHEYLLDMASAEGMPENQSSTRLEEVEAAILALDRPSTLPEGAWAQPVRDAAAA